jgi:hypothetical protein
LVVIYNDTSAARTHAHQKDGYLVRILVILELLYFVLHCDSKGTV